MMALLFCAFLVGLYSCVALNIRTIVSTAISHVHVINGLVAKIPLCDKVSGSRQPAQLQKLARISKLCCNYIPTDCKNATLG